MRTFAQRRAILIVLQEDRDAQRSRQTHDPRQVRHDMNQAPQQRPQQRYTLPHGPHKVIQLLIGQSSKRYAAIKEMIKNQVDGFFDLQRESQTLAQYMLQEDGAVDQRIHRLGLSLQAAMAISEINRQDLERHCQVELILQGELNRWLRGQPPTRFQGPPLPPEMAQPIVPGYAGPPPAQLPAGQPQQDGAAQPQLDPQQARSTYFRQGPNGLEPVSPGAAAYAQQPAQPQMQPQQAMMQPQMAPYGYPQQQPMFPMPQYPMQQPAPQQQAPQMATPPALQGQQMFGPWPPPPQQGYAAPPPGYAPQYPQQPPYYYGPPPSPMPANHFPVMEQSQQNPGAPPTLAPLMPPQAAPAPQYATPDAARQAVLPDASPPPAVPTSVVHFPMPPNGQQQAGDLTNGAPPAQPK